MLRQHNGNKDTSNTYSVMVIEKVIKKKGVLRQEMIMYNPYAEKFVPYREGFVNFYYNKLLVIDGTTFALGSKKKGKNDELVEFNTVAMATTDVLCQSAGLKITKDADILTYLRIKMLQSPFSNFTELLIDYQNRVNKINLWEINLMLS